ncbi:small GTP-binding protein [Fontibacillus solani]|uniref:Small GTP-binding protein n=1 Tax=Fontibacillus solani TaxID=1572857 RepID=A0A7W3SVY8_9BACL|nr:dynamin family protein [Fontibacillus solani]MBA9087271.1 small GTP-binding protein [Fontibacillus solani]
MIISRQQFRNKLETVKQVLREHLLYAQQVTDRLAAHLDFHQDVQELQQLRSNLAQGRFEIVVVGEFSTGKSTFINALIGRKVLPSKAQPTTATINYIRHAKENPHGTEEAIVFFEKGHSEHVPFQQLEQYVTEMSTLFSVVDEISHVDLYVDSPYLEDGVVIVDTPGMQSLHKKHDEITRKQIAVSNASIFLFNINHAATRTEFMFISEIQKSLDRIFFVANRCDEVDISEQSVESVVASIEGKLQHNDFFKVKSGYANVYPVSAAKALYQRIGGELATEKEHVDAARYGQFEEKLWTYLTQGEKAREMLVQPLQRMSLFYEKLLNGLEEKMQLLRGELNVDELRDSIERLQQQIETRRMALSDEKERLHLELRALKDRFRSDFEAEAQAVTDDLKRESHIQHIDDYEEFREQILSHIRTAYTGCVEQASERFKERLASLVLKYTDRFDDELVGQFGSWQGQIGRQLELRSFKQRHSAELERLKQEQKEVLQEIAAAQGLQDEFTETVSAYHHDDLLEQRRQREEELHQTRYKMTLHQLNETPQYVEEVQKREREGIIGWFKNKFVGPEEVPIRVKNEDRKSLQETMQALEHKYDATMKELDIRKKAPGLSAEEAQRRILAAEQKENQLKEQYKALRNEITRKMMQINEDQLKLLTREIENAITTAGHQVIRSYDSIITALHGEHMVNYAFDMHIRQHDQEIVEMNARIQEHEALIHINKQKQDELLGLLSELHSELSGKTEELQALQAQLA